MKLSDRLSSVLEYIDSTDIIADIGADHGYLSAAMLDLGVKHIQIVENKTEPLKRAQSTLLGYKNVSFSLSSGLNELEDCINTVTICGMGGLNIIDILTEDLDKAKKLKKLILQANSKVYELRKFLMDNNFNIIGENIVYEKNKYYEIIVCQYSDKLVNYSYEELYFGPYLIKTKSQTFIEKYKMLQKQYRKILSDTNIPSLKEELSLIDSVLEDK